MSLYFVYTPDIKSRRVNAIFYFQENKCMLLRRNKKSSTLFDVDKSTLESYKNILSYTEHNHLDSYEILYDSIIPLNEVLKCVSDYLFDKDISIGLLTDNINLLDDNQELIRSFGVTSSKVTSPISYFAVDTKSKKTKRTVSKKKKAKEPLFDMVFSPKEVSYKPSIIKKIELEESFHDKFMRYLIESNKDNVEIYKKAGVSRQVFSKIISDKNMIPTKLTLVSLCIGLELPFKDVSELMMSAGYSLSRSIVFDAIIVKFIKAGIFDFDLINSELNEYGCQLLGWHPREK